jgi:hypothetical protein
VTDSPVPRRPASCPLNSEPKPHKPSLQSTNLSIPGGEQMNYDLKEFVVAIDEAQPEKEQIGKEELKKQGYEKKESKEE